MAGYFSSFFSSQNAAKPPQVTERESLLRNLGLFARDLEHNISETSNKMEIERCAALRYADGGQRAQAQQALVRRKKLEHSLLETKQKLNLIQDRIIALNGLDHNKKFLYLMGKTNEYMEKEFSSVQLKDASAVMEGVTKQVRTAESITSRVSDAIDRIEDPELKLIDVDFDNEIAALRNIQPEPVAQPSATSAAASGGGELKVDQAGRIHITSENDLERAVQLAVSNAFPTPKNAAKTATPKKPIPQRHNQ